MAADGMRRVCVLVCSCKVMHDKALAVKLHFANTGSFDPGTGLVYVTMFYTFGFLCCTFNN